jgi:uncharacterized Zn-binding protein involved in type VI secretion
LVAVQNDPNNAGGGELIAENPQTVFAHNIPVIEHEDPANPDSACPASPHCNPATAEGSPNVFVYNKPLHRIDDDRVCGHKTVPAGNSTVFANEGNVPPVIIPAAVQAVIDQQTARYVAQPQNYPIESNDQVKRNFPGTPEQPTTVGESLIDASAANASDIIPFLDQILSEAAQGRWEETGMGGRPSNQNITGIWRELGYPQTGAWLTDQTAWCMGFVNWVLKRTGYRYVQTAWARDIQTRASQYNATQIPLGQGQPGDVALWSYGHVNFIYSGTGGRYNFVGGNQSTRAKNNNNPSQGSVTKSWPGGYRVPADGTLIGLWRPSRS